MGGSDGTKAPPRRVQELPILEGLVVGTLCGRRQVTGGRGQVKSNWSCGVIQKVRVWAPQRICVF